eukprot:Rhum_TRINITY_DN14334_c27_g1::Rhum_TRINITY_DN14334_c27_g1_i1::g.82074::m.82074
MSWPLNLKFGAIEDLANAAAHNVQDALNRAAGIDDDSNASGSDEGGGSGDAAARTKVGNNGAAAAAADAATAPDADSWGEDDDGDVMDDDGELGAAPPPQAAARSGGGGAAAFDDAAETLRVQASLVPALKAELQRTLAELRAETARADAAAAAAARLADAFRAECVSRLGAGRVAGQRDLCFLPPGRDAKIPTRYVGSWVVPCVGCATAMVGQWMAAVTGTLPDAVVVGGGGGGGGGAACPAPSNPPTYVNY